MRGFLHCVAHGETVSDSGRNDTSLISYVGKDRQRQRRNAGVLRCAQNDKSLVAASTKENQGKKIKGKRLVRDLVEVAVAAGGGEDEEEDGGVVADVDERGGHDRAKAEADVTKDH